MAWTKNAQDGHRYHEVISLVDDARLSDQEKGHTDDRSAIQLLEGLDLESPTQALVWMAWLSVTSGIEHPKRAQIAAKCYEALMAEGETPLVSLQLVNRLFPGWVDKANHPHAKSTARVVMQVAHLETLENGWHDGEGMAPSRDAIALARELCDRLLQEPGMLEPSLAPHPEGGIRIEHLGTKYFYIIDVGLDPWICACFGAYRGCNGGTDEIEIPRAQVDNICDRGTVFQHIVDRIKRIMDLD